MSLLVRERAGTYFYDASNGSDHRPWHPGRTNVTTKKLEPIDLLDKDVAEGLVNKMAIERGYAPGSVEVEILAGRLQSFSIVALNGKALTDYEAVMRGDAEPDIIGQAIAIVEDKLTAAQLEEKFGRTGQHEEVGGAQKIQDLLTHLKEVRAKEVASSAGIARTDETK